MRTLIQIHGDSHIEILTNGDNHLVVVDYEDKHNASCKSLNSALYNALDLAFNFNVDAIVEATVFLIDYKSIKPILINTIDSQVYHDGIAYTNLETFLDNTKILFEGQQDES